MALVAQIGRNDGVEELAVLEPQEQVELVRRVLAVEPPLFVVRKGVPAREELERREVPGLGEGTDEVERRRDGVAPPPFAADAPRWRMSRRAGSEVGESIRRESTPSESTATSAMSWKSPPSGSSKATDPSSPGRALRTMNAGDTRKS